MVVASLWLVLSLARLLSCSSSLLLVIPAKAGIQLLALLFFSSLQVKSFRSAAPSGLLFVIATKSNQKGLAPDAVVRFASCESDCPALLVDGGLRRQYVPVQLRRRAHRARAPSGNFRRRLRCSAPRTARAGRVADTYIRVLRESGEGSPGSEAAPDLDLRSGFCGRMPPKRGPVRRGECAGWRAGCAPVRWCTWTYTQRTSGAHSRTRRAEPVLDSIRECPESAPSGVCFSGYSLCTSKESDPLPAGERKLCSQRTRRRARSKWIPA
jgi:hypothetical protein